MSRKNTTVGIYLRVSTQEQSTELQNREVLEFVKSRGCEVFKIYEDKATGTNDKRPMFRAMSEDAHSRKFDIVICWKLDRLFRSLKNLRTTLQKFQRPRYFVYQS